MCTVLDVLHNLPFQSVVVVFYSSEFCYGYEKQLSFNSLNISLEDVPFYFYIRMTSVQ